MPTLADLQASFDETYRVGRQAAMVPEGRGGLEGQLMGMLFAKLAVPPSPEGLAAFLEDPSEVAYAARVDELLASTAFGEHWARHWLDVARYADSHGFTIDGGRTIWPWRDWVIRAFNDTLPYDDFLTWQLAGDLLPDPTADQRLATPCNRLLLTGTFAVAATTGWLVRPTCPTHLRATAMMSVRVLEQEQSDADERRQERSKAARGVCRQGTVRAPTRRTLRQGSPTRTTAVTKRHARAQDGNAARAQPRPWETRLSGSIRRSKSAGGDEELEGAAALAAAQTAQAEHPPMAPRSPVV